ncbi:MAG: uroporphyrinogen decarboxylase [Pseudomonadota bacterium]
MKTRSSQNTSKSFFLKVLEHESVFPPPIWLMRQAGRYLPEYLKTREQAGSFLDLCYNPKLACEVTLQPIKRFGFDAAILFSDILVVPDALGQTVSFIPGEGPKLTPLETQKDITALKPEKTKPKFDLIYESVSLIRENLPKETALIGFCGAPWTVATYMIGGKGSPDQATTRLFAYQKPKLFKKLIEILVFTSVDYLSGQIKAGANAIQIFDSWAGNLPDDEFRKWVIKSTEQIVSQLKARHPNIPVIGFPKGIGPKYPEFVAMTKVNAVSCDTALPLTFIQSRLQNRVAVQGNLDPLLLVSGGQALDKRIDEILQNLSNGPFIFNLGHGILPQTPISHVEQLVKRIRQSS